LYFPTVKRATAIRRKSSRIAFAPRRIAIAVSSPPRSVSPATTTATAAAGAPTRIVPPMTTPTAIAMSA
jgi:hypothetical protein